MIRRGRSFSLIELLAVIGVTMLVMMVLGLVVVSVTRAARLVRDRDMRIASIDAFSRQIREDARLAVRCSPRWVEVDGVSAPALVLQGVDGEGARSETVFVFRRDRVQKLVDGVQSSAWSAPYLEFHQAVARAGGGDVLRVTFAELPSPSSEQRRPRETELCVPLPEMELAATMEQR